MKMFLIRCPYCYKLRQSEVYKITTKPKYRLCFYCGKRFNLMKCTIKEIIAR